VAFYNADRHVTKVDIFHKFWQPQTHCRTVSWDDIFQIALITIAFDFRSIWKSIIKQMILEKETV
jgi:hypothetical protein